MEALFASDAVQVTTENEVYTLMGCWIFQTTTDASNMYDEILGYEPYSITPFRHLIMSVRLQHLSMDYIANVVTACPLAINSGHLSFILRSSLVARETDPTLVMEGLGINPVPHKRSCGDPFWTYTSTFNLSDIILLETGMFLYRHVDLVDGYPFFIFVAKEMQEEQNTLGAHSSLMMPLLREGE